MKTALLQRLLPGRDDPEDALIRRAARGDAQAWRVLVDGHMGVIHGLAQRMLGSPAEAEDVTQETFLRAWRTIGEWTPGHARYGTWLCQVALNLCRDRLRRARPVPLEDVPEMAEHAPSADARLHAESVARRLQEALARLPDRQREAMVLCYYQHMSNIEAARVMDVSVDALESLLSRARRKLRADLAAIAPDLLGDVT